MKQFFDYLDNGNQFIVCLSIAVVMTALFFAIDWILGDSKSEYDKYFDNNKHE